MNFVSGDIDHFHATGAGIGADTAASDIDNVYTTRTRIGNHVALYMFDGNTA